MCAAIAAQAQPLKFSAIAEMVQSVTRLKFVAIATLAGPFAEVYSKPDTGPVVKKLKRCRTGPAQAVCSQPCTDPGADVYSHHRTYCFSALFYPFQAYLQRSLF